MRGAEQPQQELRAVGQPEVGRRRRRSIERVGSPLHREERRTFTRERAHTREPCARQDHGRAHAPVSITAVIRVGERCDPAVGLTRDRDSRRVDLAAQDARGALAHREQSADDEAYIARLIDEIGLVRPAGSGSVCQREHRRSDDIARLRPCVEQGRVARRRESKSVREDDKRMRAVRGRRPRPVRASGGGTRRRGMRSSVSDPRNRTRGHAPPRARRPEARRGPQRGLTAAHKRA